MERFIRKNIFLLIVIIMLVSLFVFKDYFDAKKCQYSNSSNLVTLVEVKRSSVTKVKNILLHFIKNPQNQIIDIQQSLKDSTTYIFYADIETRNVVLDSLKIIKKEIIKVKDISRAKEISSNINYWEQQ